MFLSRLGAVIFIISGSFWKGSPNKILGFIMDTKFEWFVSIKQFSELRRVLNYPKFRLFYLQQQKIINFIYEYSEIIDVITKINVIKEDPSDNMFLECAVESGAKYIISGDKHLLKLKKYRDIKIVSPKDFLELCEF